jgi:ferredoxin-NADP reductase
VKREANGRVSNWLHDHLKAGDVLSLALPAGDFVLSQTRPEALLMLAAGSGITPLMAQLRALLQQGHTGSIAFLHYVRSDQDRIFAQDLQALAAQHSNLCVHWCFEYPQGDARAERFNAEQLSLRVADYATRHTLLCGPAGFMAAVRSHWDTSGLNEQLQFEYFGSVPALVPLAKASGIAAHVQLARRGKQVDAAKGQSLLLALEAAGETPAYGCRQGICQSCKCRKTSGQVRNLITGEVSHEPEEDIQLCISVAESDLVLNY